MAEISKQLIVFKKEVLDLYPSDFKEIRSKIYTYENLAIAEYSDDKTFKLIKSKTGKDNILYTLNYSIVKEWFVFESLEIFHKKYGKIVLDENAKVTPIKSINSFLFVAEFVVNNERLVFVLPTAICPHWAKGITTCYDVYESTIKYRENLKVITSYTIDDVCEWELINKLYFEAEVFYSRGSRSKIKQNKFPLIEDIHVESIIESHKGFFYITKSLQLIKFETKEELNHFLNILEV